MGIFRYVTTDARDNEVHSHGDAKQALRFCKVGKGSNYADGCYVFKYVGAYKKGRKMK